MSHWYTVEQLVREHHADLDREASRVSRAKAVRGARPERPSLAGSIATAAIAWLRTAVRTRSGTNVNVTNQGLPTQPAPPATGGSLAVIGGTDGVLPHGLVTAHALSIHMTSGAMFVRLHAQTDDVALFQGPSPGGWENADILVSLSRPIAFDHIYCEGSATDVCSVSWVGG